MSKDTTYILIPEWLARKAVEFGEFEADQVENAIKTDGIFVNKYGQFCITKNSKYKPKNNH